MSDQKRCGRRFVSSAAVDSKCCFKHAISKENRVINTNRVHRAQRQLLIIKAHVQGQGTFLLRGF